MFVLCSIAKSCLILCDPMVCSPPSSSVHEIAQARILVWVAMPSSRGPSWTRDQTQVLHTAGGYFTNWATREVLSHASDELFRKRKNLKPRKWSSKKVVELKSKWPSRFGKKTKQTKYSWRVYYDPSIFYLIFYN